MYPDIVFLVRGFKVMARPSINKWHFPYILDRIEILHQDKK